MMLGTGTAKADFPADLLPAEVRGWALAPAAETYTAEDLYRYIDGASELYISYGFRKLLARRYVREGSPEILLDLFDMGDAGNAFGIFAHSQESPGHEVGEDSEYLDGLLRFRQGRYYASLLCSPETPESRAALLELGQRVASRLGGPGGRPPELALLPEQGLLAASVRYFRHPAWQNTYQFISSENILGIDSGCRAVLARYDGGEPRPVLLIVRYPDAAASERAFAAICRLVGLQDPGGAVRLKDNKVFAAALEHRTLAAVWHAGGVEAAAGLLQAARERIRAAGRQAER